MISILIPLYNCDVNDLAGQLSSQLATLSIPGEIILLDDGSSPAYRSRNAPISFPGVQYAEAGSNYGRIRIRQLLAEKAKYDWLLFLDCDSKIISDRFLQNYMQHLSSTPGVFVGGRIYQQQMPADCSLRLHWLYGSKREVFHTAGFMSNNFLVHKNIFQQLSFVKDWQGYGHEDTWIGIQLEKIKAPLKYIDNVVLHDGLEKVEAFIPKSEQALQNLLKLEQLVPGDSLKKHIKLYRVYARLRSLGLLWLPQLIYKLTRRKIFNNLQSCNPSLFYFDLYRLHQFIQLSRPHK